MCLLEEASRLHSWDGWFSSPFHCSAATKSLQSCPTLCYPIDGSPPGSPVPGILQARTLEWVAISFANAWKLKVKVKSISRVQLLVTPWTAAHQAPPSMGFSRQEYWSGVPLPSPFHCSTCAQCQTLLRWQCSSGYPELLLLYLLQPKPPRIETSSDLLEKEICLLSLQKRKKLLFLVFWCFFFF